MCCKTELLADFSTILKNMRAFCEYILHFQKIFFDIIEIILERHTPARALRAISHRPKKKKYPEKKLILAKFWQTFFSKFHILCLLYANHTIMFCETYTTLKLLKIKFYEICSNSKDFIFKFRKKNLAWVLQLICVFFFDKKIFLACVLQLICNIFFEKNSENFWKFFFATAIFGMGFTRDFWKNFKSS